jgi:hypothetical protein
MGFAAQPLDDLTAVVWTDVTSYVLNREAKTGAQHELSRVDAGTGHYLFDNRDRRFDPTNTAGPYWPNIRLGVVFQERATWAGTTYPVFTGYVDDWDLQWPDVADAETMVSCVDAFKFFNLHALDTSAWKIEVRKDVSANIAAGRNTAWIRLDNATGGNVASDYSGTGFDGTYQNGPRLGLPSIIAGDTDTAMDVPHTADCRASLAWPGLLTGWPFTVEFVMRRWQNRSQAAGLFVAFEAGGDPLVMVRAYVDITGLISVTIANPYPTRTSAFSTIPVDDGVIHHVAIVATAANDLKIWIDGVDRTTPGTTSTFAWPRDLATGYALGNFPAVAYGDYGFEAGSGTDPVTGRALSGGLQSFVFYDGLALSFARINAHATAALTGWGAEGSGARINHVLDAVGWPVSNRAIDTGAATIAAGTPGGTALAHLQLVADTEGGRFFMDPAGVPTFHSRNRALTDFHVTTTRATFSDDGTFIPYLLPMDPHLDDLDWWTRAVVSRVNGAPQTWDAIPGNNAPRTLTRSGLLMAAERDARAMAQYLISIYKTAVPRIRSLTFEPQAAPTTGWPAALSVGIGDRVTVRRHPLGGGPMWTQDSIVEGITHTWSSGLALWRTTYALSPAPVAKTYFMLGTSTLGGADLLFY